MKQLKVAILGASLALAASTFGTTTINLGIDRLFTAAGAPSVVPNGILLQLVAVGADGNFSLPTPGQFVTGDDVLLASFFLDTSTVGGVPGSTGASITFNYTAGFTIGGYNAQAVAGQVFELRWFPTISTFSSAALTLGQTYGRFTTASATPQMGSDQGWVITNEGANNALFFFTQSGSAESGGAIFLNPDAAGRAGFVVIPEPSTYLLGLVGALGMIAASRFRRSFPTRGAVAC